MLFGGILPLPLNDKVSKGPFSRLWRIFLLLFQYVIFYALLNFCFTQKSNTAYIYETVTNNSSLAAIQQIHWLCSQSDISQ